MGNLVYLEGFAGSEEDPSGASLRPMPMAPHRNPYAFGTKPWAWWDAGYRGKNLFFHQGTYEGNIWQAGRDAALADSGTLTNSEEDPSGASRRPMPLLPKYRNLLPTENRLRPVNSKITPFVDRPRALPNLRGLPSLSKSPRDGRERKNRGTSAFGVANPYWKQGIDDGHGPTMGPGGQLYATTAPYQRTRRDGYVYSAEYWETLHKMQLLFDKNQGWIPGVQYSAQQMAELDQYNAMNAEMNAKTAAAVKANDPMLYALQQANAKYAQTHSQADLEAYNAAYAAWWADKAAWEAAHPDLEAPAKTGTSSAVQTSTRPVLPGGGLVLVVSKGSSAPLEDWQKDAAYLRSLGYYDTPMPAWDEATQTFVTPKPRQGSAADYAIWKRNGGDLNSGESAHAPADPIPPGPKQRFQVETPTPIQMPPASTAPAYPLPAPPAGAQDFAPVDQSHNYTNATPISVSHASPDPYRNRNAPMAYAVPDQGLRYRGGPVAPTAAPTLPGPAESESWLQSSSIIPNVRNLYLVGGAAALLGFLFLMPKSAAAK